MIEELNSLLNKYPDILTASYENELMQDIQKFIKAQIDAEINNIYDLYNRYIYGN